MKTEQLHTSPKVTQDFCDTQVKLMLNQEDLSKNP